MSASDKTLASASPASGNLALLAAIVVFAAITPTILMTAPAVAAQLATQWQLSPARVGDLFSVELGAMSLATLPAFHWLKRVDWRHAALLAGLLFIAANLASALAGSYPLLLALRFCSALAGGSLMILCLSSAASTATPSRVYGLWVMGQLVVGAVGLALLPALFERFGLAACYLVLAGLMGLALPLSRAFPSGSPPAEARASTGAVHSRLRVGLGILAVLTFYISLSGVWTFIGAIAEGAGISAGASGEVLAGATLMGIAGGLRLLHRQPPAARPDAARRLPGDGRGDPPADRPATAGALRPGRAAVQVHLDLRPAVHPRLPRRPGPLRPPDERLQPGHRRRAGHRPGAGRTTHRRQRRFPPAAADRRRPGRPLAAAGPGLPATLKPFPEPRIPAMTRRTAFFFDELCLWHAAGPHALTLPVGGWVQPPAAAGHAESPETKRRLKSLLDVSGLTARLQLRSAPPASDEDLLRVHPAHYLERFKALSDAGGGSLGQDAPIGPGSYEIARLSAGLAIAALDAVLAGQADNAYSLSRPPGHHCLPDQAMGFCFFANIAVAIEAAKARHGVERVAVLDWDVHHGNGTQAIYYRRDDVLSISLHQDGCFPPGYSGAEDIGEDRGRGFNLNVPLLPGGGHDAYMQAMQRIVLPALERFRPQLIVVASGFDANAVDPLARMQLHSDSFRAMTAMVRDAAERHAGGRLVVVHEGGYSEAYVPFCGLAVIEELSGVRSAVRDPLRDFIELQQPNAAFRDFQRQRLEELAAQFGLCPAQPLQAAR